MSSNYRTLAIFLCAALKVPLLYFVLELLGLTLLSVFMLGLQKARCREFARFLDQQVS
jgi:hypothetical protein